MMGYIDHPMRGSSAGADDGHEVCAFDGDSLLVLAVLPQKVGDLGQDVVVDETSS
jgi:hypothetical protein